MIKPPNRFLPREIWDRKWSPLEDVTALEIGDWVFDPSSGAHYAGKVTRVYDNCINLMEIEWHKSPDNVFFDCLSKYKACQMIWIDPMDQNRED